MRDLAAGLERQKSLKLYRSRRIVEGPQGPETSIDGQQILSFCSNDYLGLANHPDVVAALQQGARQYGVGSGASHLINGHSRAHHALEEALADFTNSPRALLFSTGYMANLGAISALARRGDTIFEDRLNHASLIDAARLSDARLRRYRHADCAELASSLTAMDSGTAFILSDGVFSMDGDITPLPELITLAQQHQALLMLDDAHGFGVLGSHGGGVAEYYGMQAADIPLLIGTLGKAFGTFGAFVAGSEELIETLIQHARTYIYTTALPPAIAHATLTSLEIVRKEDWRRSHLNTMIERFRSGASSLGIGLPPSQTPIQPLLIGDNDKTLSISEALLQKGILISAIRPPTVPEGSARLRITLSTAHSEAQIDRLLDTLSEVI